MALCKMEGSSTSSVTTAVKTKEDGSFSLPKQLEDISPATEFPNVQHRWNTNEEIAAILIAFDKHKEWQGRELKTRPPSGSMLLYSRKNVRYRKDGYCWKKRRDGKTIREDHMKLKVQGLECINGSYVHSAILPTFHRRCYWLLQNPDIVLVHFLNVPYPDNAKLSIPVVSYAMEKKEWTKEELVDQLQPMFTAGSQNEECMHMIEETVEAIVQQLIDFQDKQKTKPHVCYAKCDKNCSHSKCCKISPRGEFNNLSCSSGTSIHNRLVSLLQRNSQKVATQTTMPQGTRSQSVVLSSTTTATTNVSQQPFILSLGSIPNNGLILVSGQPTTPISIISTSSNTLQQPNVINSQVTNLQQPLVIGSCIESSTQPHIIQQPEPVLTAPVTRISVPANHYTSIPATKMATSNNKKEICGLFLGVNNQIFSVQMSDEGNLKIDNVKSEKNDQMANQTLLPNNNDKIGPEGISSSNENMDSYHGSMTSLTEKGLNLDNLDLLDLPDLEKLCNDVEVLENNLAICDTTHATRNVPMLNSMHLQTRTSKGPTSTVGHQSQHGCSENGQLKLNSVAITDFSPDWSYTEGGTKVLIAGPWYSSGSAYSCLFDGKNVEATYVQSGVIRCFTPAHDRGLVSLQIACDGYVVSNSVVFEFKDKEKSEFENGQQDWFSLDENQLRLLLVERIEQLEKQLNLVSGDTNLLKQIPLCEFEDKVECYIKKVISQLWSNADTFPKTGTLALTLLHLAAGLGYSKLIHTLIQLRSENSNWLLEYEVDAHSVDQNSCTPLMWACAKGRQTAAVTLYHWNKSTLKICNKEGHLPLYIARKKGHHSLANEIDQMGQSEMDTSVFESTQSFVHTSPNAIFSVSPSRSSSVPIASTPISKASVFHSPPSADTVKPVLENLYIDIPAPYPVENKLIRRRSDQMIQDISSREQLSKRFSIDILSSCLDSSQFSPRQSYPKPVREANSEPRLSVCASNQAQPMAGQDNPMFSGRDLSDMDIQTESFLEGYKLSSDNIVPIGSYPAVVPNDSNSLLIQMDTDEFSSVRSDSPYIDVVELSPHDEKLNNLKHKKGESLSGSCEGSDEAKHQMVTLAKQIIAAMPERIKSSPSRADDVPPDEILRERSSSHSSIQSQLSPHASSYEDDSGISTPMGGNWAFDEYRYTDIGTPASSMSPDSTCLPSPYSPYNFQLDSPPPTTADFTEYFNAPATFMEKDFSQLTLSDQEQRRLYEAAKVIQHAYRHYRDKQQQQQKEIEAAILIQSYYRRYKQYAYYKKMTQAAVLIQSQFRSYYAQKRFKKSRDAAVVIQNQYRSYKEHERLKKSRNKSVIIQQRFRSHYQRKLADAAENGQVVQLVSEAGDGLAADSSTTQTEASKAIDAENSTLPQKQGSVATGETTEVPGSSE